LQYFKPGIAIFQTWHCNISNLALQYFKPGIARLKCENKKIVTNSKLFVVLRSSQGYYKVETQNKYTQVR